MGDSQEFYVQRGVKQGSMISPGLFLLVMDPPSHAVAGLRAGSLHQQLLCRAFLHADDVRTLDSSRASLETEATMVEEFAEQNFLSLNAGKYEVVDFSRNHRANYPPCTLGEALLTKCVGK